MKIDPYDNKEKHLELNESVQLRIKGVTKENSDIILRYLEDMKKAIKRNYNPDARSLNICLSFSVMGKFH